MSLLMHLSTLSKDTTSCYETMLASRDRLQVVLSKLQDSVATHQPVDALIKSMEALK